MCKPDGISLISPQPRHEAGLFFRPQSRAHIGMDKDLQHVIRQALVDAQAVGKDSLT